MSEQESEESAAHSTHPGPWIQLFIDFHQFSSPVYLSFVNKSVKQIFHGLKSSNFGGGIRRKLGPPNKSWPRNTSVGKEKVDNRCILQNLCNFRKFQHFTKSLQF